MGQGSECGTAHIGRNEPFLVFQSAKERSTLGSASGISARATRA